MDRSDGSCKEIEILNVTGLGNINPDGIVGTQKEVNYPFLHLEVGNCRDNLNHFLFVRSVPKTGRHFATYLETPRLPRTSKSLASSLLRPDMFGRRYDMIGSSLRPVNRSKKGEYLSIVHNCMQIAYLMQVFLTRGMWFSVSQSFCI